MEPFKVIDVTLRDGGHHNHFFFPRSLVKEILNLLDKAKVDYIELGYRNGYLNSKHALGEAGMCALDYLSFCRQQVLDAKLAVMAHPSLVGESDIREIKECGIDLLRICVGVGKYHTALPIIELAHKYQLAISVNFTHVSQYQSVDLKKAVTTVAKMPIDMIYFADSNGSLLSFKISQLYQCMTSEHRMAFGFHGHDNLGLAQMNTISALEAGATMVDFSLLGLGKGIGNLKASFFIAYLQANEHRQYDLNAIVQAEKLLLEALALPRMAGDMGEFIRGIHDLSTAQLKKRQQATSEAVALV